MEPFPYRMRDLVAQTGLSAPAIHFYALQGLLPSARKTAGNQARYSEATLARLRWIRTLQAELRLPLRLIGSILKRWGELPLEEVRAMQAVGRLLDEPDTAVSREQLAAVEARLGSDDVAALTHLGLVRRLPKGGISHRDLRLLELCAATREAGFTDEAGFGVAQLGLYRDAMERLVGEELGRIVEPILRRRDPAEVRDLIHRGLPLVDRLLALLHARAVQDELERWLSAETAAAEAGRHSA